MNRSLSLRAALAACALASSFASLSVAAPPEPGAHKLGDHPAVVVQRLQRQAGYDYASKFYPHPAGLRLYTAQPQEPGSESAATAKVPDDRAAHVAHR
jgi:hypothetical protein